MNTHQKHTLSNNNHVAPYAPQLRGGIAAASTSLCFIPDDELLWTVDDCEDDNAQLVSVQGSLTTPPPHPYSTLLTPIAQHTHPAHATHAFLPLRCHSVF